MLLNLNIIQWVGIIISITIIIACIFYVLLLFSRKITNKRIRNILEDLFHDDTEGLNKALINCGINKKSTDSQPSLENILNDEHSFKEFIEQFPEIIFEIDTNGIVLYANKLAYKVFGYSKEDVKRGVSIFQVIDKEYIEVAKENFGQLFHNYNDVQGAEYKLITKSGESMYCAAYTKPLTKKNQIISFRGVLLDITEKRKSLDTVQVYSDIIQNMQLGFMIFQMLEIKDDRSFTLISCNKAASLFVNKKCEEIIGEKIDDVLPFYRSRGLPDILKEIVKTGRKFEIENFIHQFNPEDELMFFNLKIFAISKNRVVLFFEDISERKKAEELERRIEITKQSAALKQQFLANMSHEIRTPMTGIMGMLSLLFRTNLDDIQSEYVKSIKVSSENLLNIINDILDLSKIEAGKMELKPASVNLEKICQHFLELFNAESKVKSLDFIHKIDENIPHYIIVDETRLRQIIGNLLSNAFKFTDEGSVSLTFTLLDRFEDHIVIQCEVTDTGVGITKKNQNKIFNKYTQLESSYTLPFEGTGLGLAICKELTRLMGGHIQVNSKIGEGSIFAFTFKAGYDISSEHSESISENSSHPKLGLNVLLVEDKALNRKVARLMLEHAGCTVEEAVNGEEAITAFKPGKFDLILMDIQMPVMDGITALNNLKRIHTQVPPVIGISANAMEGDREKFIALGMNEYLVKPFRYENLYELLQKHGKKN